MLFSVITPSRNQLNWLKLCAASVADQVEVGDSLRTRPPATLPHNPVAADVSPLHLNSEEGQSQIEHIIQDACSTDGTVEWLSQKPNLHWRSEPDAGMYDAINRGLHRAQGEILSYLNCDEQYLPGALHKVAEFFAAHPDVDVVFGDIVMVDEHGEYLCHRKVQAPGLYHTWTCHLSTLSCAMFFRRRLTDSSGMFFDTSYRCGGDGEWMVRLLRAGMRMAALGQFTSVFTRTGVNLGRDQRAREEKRRLARTAPLWMRLGAPIWVLHHRLRRWQAGAYRQAPFAFSLFTQKRPNDRVGRHVARPVFRQNW